MVIFFAYFEFFQISYKRGKVHSYDTNLKFVSVKNSGKNDSKFDIVSFVCV